MTALNGGVRYKAQIIKYKFLTDEKMHHLVTSLAVHYKWWVVMKYLYFVTYT